MAKKFAGIVVDHIHPSLDKLFHYAVPESIENHIQVGVRVQVPLVIEIYRGMYSLDERLIFPKKSGQLINYWIRNRHFFLALSR